MKSEGIRWVVPKQLFGKYPDSVQPALLSLESFIEEIGVIEWLRSVDD